MTGTHMREWRQRMGWTQLFAASKMGISVASLQSYESGKRSDKPNPIIIPVVVALAVSALNTGLGPYAGKR